MKDRCDGYISGFSRIVYFLLHLVFFTATNTVSAFITEDEYYMVKMIQICTLFAIFTAAKSSTQDIPALHILRLAQ